MPDSPTPPTPDQVREALKWAEKAEDIERGDMAYDDEYQALVEAARDWLRIQDAERLDWCDWHDSPSHGVGMVYCDLVLEKSEPDHKCLMSKRLVVPI